MLEGGMVNRCEIYDEADLDAALTRFDELHAGARHGWKTRQAECTNISWRVSMRATGTQ